MVSKFGRLLAASGIVQLDRDEQGTSADASRTPSEEDPSVTMQDQPPASDVSATVGNVLEQKPFSDLYREANLPASPFSAEKLLKLMDGLSSMPIEVRKQAIKAMDDADDSWTIEDAILDAQRKVKTLAVAKESIRDQVRIASKQAEDEAASLNRHQQDAAAQIRKQIADLSALLDRETAKVSQSIAEVKAKARSNEEAAAREVARMDVEITRLSQISAMFSAPPDNDKARSAA